MKLTIKIILAASYLTILIFVPTFIGSKLDHIQREHIVNQYKNCSNPEQTCRLVENIYGFPWTALDEHITEAKDPANRQNYILEDLNYVTIRGNKNVSYNKLAVLGVIFASTFIALFVYDRDPKRKNKHKK